MKTANLNQNYQIDNKQLVFDWKPDKPQDGKAINFVNDLNKAHISESEDSESSHSYESNKLSMI